MSLRVERGELFALLGPSGCGKTTLLRLIAGFETPDHGRIVLDGEDITGLPPYLRPVNMMFQSYALFPHLDAAANIGFGLRSLRMDRRRRRARVAEMLALVQMTDYAGRRPHQLSGGQRQRVALARALARMPKLLLLDEPLAALDRKLRGETRFELTAVQERVGTTFLFVTHDQEEALAIASRLGVMNAGRLIQTGAPAEIYERPNSRFVAGFVGEVNLFEGVTARGDKGMALLAADIAAPLPLPPSASGLPAGETVALALRPEKLLLSTDRPAGFALCATVTAIAYQGGMSSLSLATAQGRTLKARLPSAEAAKLGRGVALWASWAPTAAILLTQ